MHAGMQRLDPAIEHFRKAGEVGDVAHRQARFPQQTRGAAGRNQLDVERTQAMGEIGESGFIGNAEQGALDAGHGRSSLSEERNRGRAGQRTIGMRLQFFGRSLSFTRPSSLSTQNCTAAQWLMARNSAVLRSMKLAKESKPLSGMGSPLRARAASKSS